MPIIEPKNPFIRTIKTESLNTFKNDIQKEIESIIITEEKENDKLLSTI